jgi:hypothetical protein
MACSKGGSSGDFVDPNGGGHVTNSSDTIPPGITINTPADNQVFSSGNTIPVSGRATDNNGLYRGHIRITNDANGALLKEQLYEIHGLLGYNFSINYATAVSATSNYTITVWFEDHGYNGVTRSVKVKVNP